MVFTHGNLIPIAGKEVEKDNFLGFILILKKYQRLVLPVSLGINEGYPDVKLNLIPHGGRHEA